MTATAQTAPAAGAQTAWKLDPTHTTVEFSAKHLMISTVKGRITDIEGTIYTNEEEPTRSSVEATLKTASIDTRTDQRDQHLRSADFLNVGKYPEIKFQSTRVEGSKQEFKLTGDLTIRDVTRPITLSVTFEGQAKDYGLTWNQLLETGGVAVGHEIKIGVEVEAIRVNSSAD